MRIFGNLKISLLQVLSIGGRKSVHAPPPHAHLCFPVFLTSDRPWVDSNFRLYGPHFYSHTRCACPPPMHTLRFPYFLIKSDHFQALEIHKSEKLLVRGPDSESKTQENEGLKEPTTASRRPHQARLQIDLQNDLQIDYLCNLTT